MQKLCSKCGISKSNNLFGKCKKSKDGLRYDCKECKRKVDKEWRLNNKDKITAYKRKNDQKNNKKYLPKKLAWEQKQRKENPEFRIKQNLRNRLKNALKSNKKNKTFDIIDTSIEFFKDWLEYQFDSKMSWDNYGSYWHIDHVIPCSSFNFTHLEQQKECFNWKNCRPMEASSNMSKNNKILKYDIVLQELKVKHYLNNKQATHLVAGTPLLT
jgi:hypothetical protein